MLHKNITTGDVHYIHNWSVADNTARDALTVAATDVGKVCQVTGTSSYYLLTNDSPMTWFDLTSTAGIGDVVGPASATDNAIVRFDLTTGKLIQDSGITIADGATGTLSGTNSGDVTIDSTAADILGLTGQAITADDPGADRIVFWDDSAGKLTHLALQGLSFSTTNLVSTQCIAIACSDETTALTTGTAKTTFRMPYAFTLTEVRASVTTAPTGATLNIDINEGGVSILSTTITIDASEKTSTTAATPPVISDTSLADDAEITIDIDQVGSTVAGAGLKVYLIGYKT